MPTTLQPPKPLLVPETHQKCSHLRAFALCIGCSFCQKHFPHSQMSFKSLLQSYLGGDVSDNPPRIATPSISLTWLYLSSQATCYFFFFNLFGACLPISESWGSALFIVAPWEPEQLQSQSRHQVDICSGDNLFFVSWTGGSVVKEPTC